MTAPPYRPRGFRRPEHDPVFRAQRRTRRVRQELLARSGVAILIFVFNELVGGAAGPDPLIRATTLAGLLVNVPYYLLAQRVPGQRLQAHARMLGDVALVTVGLYSAGGLAAGAFVGVYALVPVYVGIVFSSSACLYATAAATLGYLAVAGLQEAGWLPLSARPAPDAWVVAGFNLLVLNVVGGLTALLAEAYRQSRHRLATLYQDLERAHDAALRLNTEIQRGARLHVLGEVVAGVAHDVSNALQAVLLASELLRHRLEGPAPEVRRHVDQIRYGTETAMRIVRNVLQTARHSSAEKVTVALPEVVRRIADLKGYDLRRDGIDIEVAFPPDFPFVLGAPFQLQQILLNLVVNAQEALRGRTGHRAIQIHGRVLPEQAIVAVRDSGPGISPDVLPRIFEPFFTTKTQGTGLGLAISADLARDLGGELTARNGPEGGAIFELSLPAIRYESSAGA